VQGPLCGGELRRGVVLKRTVRADQGCNTSVTRPTMSIKKQGTVRDETPDRTDLDAREVRRHQTLPVSFQKRRPSGVRVSLGNRFDAVISEDIGDGAASNLVAQIGQCAPDSRVFPRGIFKRHLQYEIDDRLHDAWPAWAAPAAVVPFGRHQLPVPSQKRLARPEFQARSTGEHQQD
jgi:hypothetical protein